MNKRKRIDSNVSLRSLHVGEGSVGTFSLIDGDLDLIDLDLSWDEDGDKDGATETGDTAEGRRSSRDSVVSYLGRLNEGLEAPVTSVEPTARTTSAPIVPLEPNKALVPLIPAAPTSTPAPLVATVMEVPLVATVKEVTVADVKNVVKASRRERNAKVIITSAIEPKSDMKYFPVNPDSVFNIHNRFIFGSVEKLFMRERNGAVMFNASTNAILLKQLFILSPNVEFNLSWSSSRETVEISKKARLAFVNCLGESGTGKFERHLANFLSIDVINEEPTILGLNKPETSLFGPAQIDTVLNPPPVGKILVLTEREQPYFFRFNLFFAGHIMLETSRHETLSDDFKMIILSELQDSVKETTTVIIPHNVLDHRRRKKHG